MDFDAAQFLMDGLATAYAEKIIESWEEVYATFNPGQASIYEQAIGPTLYDYAESAASDFPDVDAADYEDACYSAYDSEVMEQAFSETIERPIPELEDLIARGQELQAAIDLFEIFDL